MHKFASSFPSHSTVILFLIKSSLVLTLLIGVYSAQYGLSW